MPEHCGLKNFKNVNYSEQLCRVWKTGWNMNHKCGCITSDTLVFLADEKEWNGYANCSIIDEMKCISAIPNITGKYREYALPLPMI